MKTFSKLFEDSGKSKYLGFKENTNEIINEGLFQWLKNLFYKSYKWLTTSDNNGNDWYSSVNSIYDEDDLIYKGRNKNTDSDDSNDSDDSENWEKKHNIKQGDKIIGKLIKPVSKINVLSKEYKKIILNKQGGFNYLGDLINKKAKLGNEPINIEKIQALEFVYQNPADDEEKMVPAGIVCLYNSFKPINDGSEYLTLIDIEESNIMNKKHHDTDCLDMFNIFVKIAKKQFPGIDQIVYYIPNENYKDKIYQKKNVITIKFNKTDKIETIFTKKI